MRIASVLLSILSVVIATPPLDAQGTITGTIRYIGLVPPNQRVMTTDGQVIVHNDIVVHPKTKGLRDVIVLLDWKEKVPADPKAKPVTIDQRDMLFVPRVVTVQEGQKVRFENSDNCNHCVDAKSVLSENSFNVATPMGQPYEHQFKAQKNPIPIGCALHGWMRAHVMVVPHPYHAVTAAGGAFRIDNVPAGKHTLLLIHPDTNYREFVQAEVNPKDIVDVQIEWRSLKK